MIFLQLAKSRKLTGYELCERNCEVKSISMQHLIAHQNKMILQHQLHQHKKHKFKFNVKRFEIILFFTLSILRLI